MKLPPPRCVVFVGSEVVFVMDTTVAATTLSTTELGLYATFQVKPAGSVGKLVVANVPLMHGEVAAQVRIVKMLPDAGTKPLSKETLRVPASVAAPVPVGFT